MELNLEKGSLDQLVRRSALILYTSLQKEIRHFNLARFWQVSCHIRKRIVFVTVSKIKLHRLKIWDGLKIRRGAVYSVCGLVVEYRGVGRRAVAVRVVSGAWAAFAIFADASLVSAASSVRSISPAMVPLHRVATGRSLYTNIRHARREGPAPFRAIRWGPGKGAMQHCASARRPRHCPVNRVAAGLKVRWHP